MKLCLAFAAAAALVVAAPALADTAPAAPVQATAKPLNTTETTIGELVANPATKAVLDKYIPGLTSDEGIVSMVSAMTLRSILPMAGDKITVKMLDDMDAELAKLPAK